MTPIWFLMFPYSSDHKTLDASFITPELLEMLVQNGMDVNAVWNGKRVLVKPLVSRSNESGTRHVLVTSTADVHNGTPLV